MNKMDSYEESWGDSEDKLHETDYNCAITSVQFTSRNVKDADSVEDDGINPSRLLEEHYSQRDAQWFQNLPFKKSRHLKSAIHWWRLSLILLQFGCYSFVVFFYPVEFLIHIRFPLLI